MNQTTTEKYQLLSEQERVIVNSTMYLGSNVRTPTEDYYLQGNKLVKKELDIHYLLRKMADEIYINVTDHSTTQEGKHLSKMDVEIGEDYISVQDNGGIPIRIHEELNMYIPFLIFGNLGGGSKTGFDEESSRGGQNKIGASLVNILSHKFIVETADGKQSYKQTFSENMTKHTEPEIEASRKKYTKITFYPDFEKIKYFDEDGTTVMNKFTDDDVVALHTRVYEIAICNPKIVVKLNKKKVVTNSMEKYAELISASNDKVCISNNTWDLCVIPSDNREFDHISFVNSIRTHDYRSTHVNYIADKIVAEIRAFIYKKHKIDIKPADVKNSMRIVLSAKIREPKFDSQVKECLTTPVSTFDRVIKIDDKFVKKLIVSDVVSNLVEWAKNKSIKLTNEKLRKKEEEALANDPKFILKFSDATSSHRELCRLFLTEGDSANKSVVSSRNTKFDGSFPLKGVPLNVRGVKIDKVLKNEELFNIVTISGLKIGMTKFTKPEGQWFNVKIENKTFMMNENDMYTCEDGAIRKATKRYIQDEVLNPEEYMDEYNNNDRIRRCLNDNMRFDEIILTPDADVDGYKIAALHINNFTLLWPDFIKEGRLKLLKTPIIRISNRKQEFEFYSKFEFEEWQKDNSLKGFEVSYIKGLSGHSEVQFRKYINNPKNFYTIKYNEGSNELLDEMFAADKSNVRKEWLD